MATHKEEMRRKGSRLSTEVITTRLFARESRGGSTPRLMPATEFILSDLQLKIICMTNGSLTLALNILCLYLIKKLHRILVRNIYVVTLLLQALFLAQNVLFNFMLVPFVYTEYGGGYCIGIVCESKILPYWAAYTVLTCSISGLFTLLLFFRLQNLLFAGSTFRLSNANSKAFSVFVMVGINIVTVRYIIVNVMINSDQHIALFKELCPSCNWIDSDRNFGVIPVESAKMNTIIVFVTMFIGTAFGLACAWHIMKIMWRHRKNSVIRGSKFTITILQTRQSFIQIFFFTAFLAVPILMFISRSIFHVSDDILIPTTLLLSLSSFVHSAVLIASTPAFMKHIRELLFGEASVEKIASRSPRSTVLCPTCDWIERHRNFAVLSAYSARVDGVIVVGTVLLYGAFTFLCAVHIMNIMLVHRSNSTLRGVRITVTHRQTRQSLVQVFVFGAFLAIPILMIMSLPLLGFSDGILVPTIILLSLSSLVHSVTLLSSTPPFRKLIRKTLLPRNATAHETTTATTFK
ncbi:hypothetical protein PRIPAC_81974 [Pristionchus pacificus]|uniref:G protein-coupled receptor n=1 Tax=Pristionchus pacificus TaxID=54126 RepID=A0A2A6CNR9_PRIPA|nr:hypothetical protein PRIPAC_81974 [Pristionchus pacificus]|eukprot:PDM79671.1 G protein-coupled receptor [Pristionchus pacificus]